MRTALCATLVAAAGIGPAAAIASPEPIRLHPTDGGHWESGVGLSDSLGRADQALVRVVDGSDDHPEVASITGLEGRDTSAVERLGFAVAGDDATIIPCIRVAFTDAVGARHEVMITSRTMRAEPGREPGWTVYRFDTGLPQGGTIEAVELGLHLGGTTPPVPVRVRFDDVVVNGDVFTHAGDSGGRS